MTQAPFAPRHIGPASADTAAMLATLGLSSLDELADKVVPPAIRLDRALALPAPRPEREAIADLAAMAAENKVQRCYLGQGYYGTLTPAVILRNILENPAWYTAYTPYQAEIAQGRLEALVVFQTMVQDLTGMAVSGASLLDEATAAAEAMALCHRAHDGSASAFFVSNRCHPQTIEVVRTRAEPLGFEVVVGDEDTWDFGTQVFGALIQYPGTDGAVRDPSPFADKVHAHGALLVVATDLLALTLLKPPGELGADVVIGSAQRFGVPMGAGGPHAAFLAATDAQVRKMPGRIIGLSRDAQGDPAYRMALQTREQHIRRQKATSNVCTAQVLLAVMAAMYAVYHGPEGLTAIALDTHNRARRLAAALKAAGHKLTSDAFFDTVEADLGARLSEVDARAAAADVLLRHAGGTRLSAALDETTTDGDVADLLRVFGATDADDDDLGIPASLRRTTPFLTAEVFQRYRSETEMLRYMYRLQTKDLSLATAMIPLGSCTMKLNATSEMIPVTWPGFGGVHPFAPEDSRKGYARLFTELEAWLAEITGFSAVSLQPNAGSQGEYAGLLVIRAWHADRGQIHRNVCLIPRSAHGTNPASAVMAGFEVVEIACDERGNVDVDDLRRHADAHADRLGALMITYPSTHGVFEEGVKEICQIIHDRGGQVYLDGANLNALVGLARPGDIGADVCHLNLHKTFCIPHGGGGPGMGPIGVAAHLAPFLPGHPEVRVGGEKAIGPVSAAPWGSASILPISWAYIAMMGAHGLADATKMAILAANYVAKRLDGHYPVLYTGTHGFVAHECIIDARPLKEFGVEVDDIAKRLMDYGFHGPTMSWPVAGTLMIEPTESESKFELDRFCDAMIAIRDEVRAIERGEWPKNDNPLKGAPHTAKAVISSSWSRAYPREVAAFPTAWTLAHKFWPTVGRVDNPYGDRNLCTSYTCGG